MRGEGLQDPRHVLEPVPPADLEHHPRITREQRANREALVEAMVGAGFRNYPMEWWHFTLHPEPAPNVALDVPVR